MGLLNRAQEIFGDKTFKNRVIVEGDVIFKQHITAFAPVPGEPSAGTAHWLTYANRSTTVLVSTAVNTLGVWSAAVTVSGIPTGTKAVYCAIAIDPPSGIGILCVERASGVTLDDITVGNAFRKYAYVRNPVTATARIGVMTWIPLDGSLQFKWCTFVTNSTVEIDAPVAYML